MRVIDAGTTVVDERLLGYLSLRLRNGDIRKYLLALPRHVAPEPPGWESIESITGVTSTEVCSSWSEDLYSNAAADRAFAALRAQQGCEYMALEVMGYNDLLAVELESLRVEAKTSLPATTEASLGTIVSHGQIVDVRLVHPTSDLTQATVVHITTSDGHLTTISVPDCDEDESPNDWWPIEVITGVPATRVARTWGSNAGVGSIRHNLMLDTVVRNFTAVVLHRTVALRPEGGVDMSDLLRIIVQERYARDGSKPVLYANVQPERVIRRTWALLQAVYGPIVFRFGSIAGQSVGKPAVVMDVDGRLKLDVLDDKDAARGVLIRAINYVMPLERAGGRPTVPPEYLQIDVVRNPAGALRPIEGLVRIPTMRRDGGVHDLPGYDALSRLWYAPDTQIDPLPRTIRPVDIRRAVATLIAPFRQFPFADESGIAATVACILEQVVRPMILGPRPLYAFDAPAFRGQGSGKSLIPEAIGALILGEESPTSPWPASDEEMGKTIATMLGKGVPIVAFDNVTKTIEYPNLAALLTSRVWSQRSMHTMSAPSLPQNATWIVTINGATFSRDLSRRVVTARLDAKMADPFKRKDFDIRQLVPWVLEHRPTLLRAALILARGWVLAGRPPDTDLVMGSYEAWVDVVGGIVRFAGLRGLARAVEESRTRDVDTVEYETIVARWWETFAGNPVSAGQISELALHYNLFTRELEAAKTPAGRGKNMGTIVAKLVGHTIQLEGRAVIVRKRDTLLHGHTVYFLQDPAADAAVAAAPLSFAAARPN